MFINITANRSVESMAEYLGINKCYLANVFRSEMGETFIEFVNRFRVEAESEHCEKRMNLF